MNQQKTGIFIAGCRKEKGMTQGQLAQRLGITDKAVSKWETGKSMPDLSLFIPLCTILEITLNELFAGERIPTEQIKEKTDEVLYRVIAKWLGEEYPGNAGEKTPDYEGAGQGKPGAEGIGRGMSEAESAGRGRPEAESTVVLKVEHVSKRYRDGEAETTVLHDVSFEIENPAEKNLPYNRFASGRGSLTGIMGASGCGKTTLLNLIATIDSPTDGTIEIHGEKITDIPEEEQAKFRREHLGFIFQEYNLIDTLTVYENIALALSVREAPEGGTERKIYEIAEKLDILSVLDKYPYEISGGQRQRCACARAVIVEPDLILADEPTGALDSGSARQLLDIFTMLCREYGVTILMVTHDVLSASYCDRILFMKGGTIRTSFERGEMSRQAFFAGILERTAWTAEEGCEKNYEEKLALF